MLTLSKEHAGAKQNTGVRRDVDSQQTLLRTEYLGAPVSTAFGHTNDGAPLHRRIEGQTDRADVRIGEQDRDWNSSGRTLRSEEHTSELQSLMGISYAVFCLNKKK